MLTFKSAVHGKKIGKALETPPLFCLKYFFSGTTRQWAITVELSEQISSDTLLERVKQTSIPKEDTIRIVKEKLNSDADVAMTSIRVNLLCPVGCSRMTTPTRTKKCNHLQVEFLKIFPILELFLVFRCKSISKNERKETNLELSCLPSERIFQVSLMSNYN